MFLFIISQKLIRGDNGNIYFFVMLIYIFIEKGYSKDAT